MSPEAMAEYRRQWADHRSAGPVAWRSPHHGTPGTAWTALADAADRRGLTIHLSTDTSEKRRVALTFTDPETMPLVDPRPFDALELRGPSGAVAAMAKIRAGDLDDAASRCLRSLG